MSDAYQTLVSLLLPAGILEYFDLVQVLKTDTGLSLFLEEKNILPEEYKNQAVESKGFLPEVTIHDFPIRGQKVALQVKRRRWQVKASGEIISRDWNIVHKGTRMTEEFAAFLKGMFR